MKKNDKIMDRVIILHGVGHTKFDMVGISAFLCKNGYKASAISYPSTRLNLEGLAAYVGGKLEKKRIWETEGKIHFVAHSLGGLVTQKYLETLPEDKRHRIGRVVMLGTPNKGSEVADYLQHFPPYQWVFGPAGFELTTSARKNAVEKPFYETGIIAGTTGWPYALTNLLVPWNGLAHDGRVTVESTKTEWMKDHLIMPITHSFMPWSGKINKQVKNFLENGVFIHE